MTTYKRSALIDVPAKSGRLWLRPLSHLAILTVAAFGLVACEGSFRNGGWLLGGKERRLVNVPAPQPDTRPASAVQGAGTPPESKTATMALRPDKIPESTTRTGSTAAEEPAGVIITRARAQKDEDILGSGEFLGSETSLSVREPRGRGEMVTLSFVDADVRDVIKTVLGGTLRQNFVIDPKVKGTITLQTSRPVPRSSVFSILESALKLNGLALVRTGEVYRVIPGRGAVRTGLRPRIVGFTGSGNQAYGVQIIPLEFVAAGEMAKIIGPVVPTGAVIRVDKARNLLVVAGTQQERLTIADFVALFDVDWLSGMSFAIVPLESAQVANVITDLERIFGTEKDGPLDGLVRFFPVERRNAVLVISARPDYIKRSRRWIKRLDIGGADKKRLYVYQVENARATDLATILNQVFSEGSAAIPSTTTVPGQKQARLSSTGSPFVKSSSSASAPKLSAQSFNPVLSGAQATTPPQITTPRQSPALRSASARANAQIGRSPIAQQLPEDLTARIVPDDVNNALVIMARPGVWRMIEDVLRKLDVVPLQVMIEATIAEVTLNDELRYGVQSFFQKGDSKFTFANAATGLIVSTFPGFSYVFQNSSIQVILDALDSVTDIRIISSPQLLVLDNRTAELRVGDSVPIFTQQSVSNLDSSAPTVNRVEFRDTGVVLRVTPRVNASGLVNLEIDQEESIAIQTTSSGIDSPTIKQRRVQTTVVVHSGETIALGGLIRETRSEIVTGIPILSSIPLIGRLFSATKETVERTELIVLITPRVIRNQEEARLVTRELRKTLRNAADIIRSRALQPGP